MRRCLCNYDVTKQEITISIVNKQTCIERRRLQLRQIHSTTFSLLEDTDSSRRFQRIRVAKFVEFICHSIFVENKILCLGPSGCWALKRILLSFERIQFEFESLGIVAFHSTKENKLRNQIRNKFRLAVEGHRHWIGHPFPCQLKIYFGGSSLNPQIE